MEFAFDKQLAPWTTLQQLWLLSQATEKRALQDIYDDFTAEGTGDRPDNVERWTGSYNAFKKRLLRLTKNGIDPAIDTATGERMAFDLGTPRGRYDYWTYLAKTTASLSTRMSALEMIEKLAPQFREVAENELDPDGYMTVGNPLRIKWDAAHLTELIHISADEYGGIHKIINFEGMNLSALELLVRAAVVVYRGKLVSAAVPFDIKELLGEAGGGDNGN